MTTENREISITANANQAVRQLSLAGNALDQLGTAVGKTDRELRQFDRAVSNSGNAMRNAQSAIVGMRDKINQLDREARASDVTIRAMGRTMDRQTEATRTATAALEASRATIREQKREITSLNTEVNALVRKLDQLEQVNRELAQNFDKLKASTKEAENGLTQYGARAVTTLTRLKALEVQMDAMTGKQLSQLNLPKSLGPGSAQSFLNNPDTQALTKMSNADLAQISQAYALQQRSLQQMVDRELTNRFAPKMGFDADSLEFSNSLRYQLYDVAGLFGVVGAAAAGLSVAFLGVGIAWEKNFANVIRTSQVTGTAVDALRDDFLELQSIIPVTSAELAEIGTLGAQMGVAAANLSRFTEVTAQFSAVSGLGVDEAATALSRLDELLPDVQGNYVALASAILKTGVNAVATEQQIVRGTAQIASMGQIAGLSTPEVVALSSAMSSLGFSPELQRSIVTSSFSKILSATTQVTEQTEKYGAVLGMTGKEFQNAWRSDALGTYSDLLSEIGNRSDAVSILQDLGLASQRLTPNLLKLGQNTEVLDTALRDSTQGMKEQTELSRQYDIIASTLAAKLQVLGQAWEALLVTLGDSSVLSPIVDVLIAIVKGLRDIAATPGLRQLATVGAVLGILAGVGALAAAGLALATAGYIAMANATIGLNVALAANSGANAANTTATLANIMAKGGQAAANAAATGATTANTVANVANTAAMNSGAISAVTLSSKMLASLPGILKFAGAVGGVAAVVTGLVALIANSKDMVFEFGKFGAGVSGGDATVRYDASKIREYTDALKEVAEQETRIRNGQRPMNDQGMPSDVPIQYWENGDLAKRLKEQRETALKDLSEEILSNASSVEAQYSLINLASKELGITQEELLVLLPDVASGMGEGAAGAAEMQEGVERLEAAMDVWSGVLATSPENLKALQGALSGASEGFIDLGAALTDAYSLEDLSMEDGFGAFLESLNSQIETSTDFENKLGELASRGARQLAEVFRSEGPGAIDALTEALNLDAGQIAEIESQLTQAAGGGFQGFLENMNTQIAEFESFSGKLSELVQKGGIQLATFFAGQGPGAMQALTDSLSLTPDQIASIEDQMSLAAFYASEAFANEFTQNNAVLIEVYRRSGGNPEAVAAYNSALNEAISNGVSISPETLAGLNAQFGLDIPIGIVPTIDPAAFETAKLQTEAIANAEPIKLTTTIIGPAGEPLVQTLDAWRITEAGKTLILKVDPNTPEGAAQIAAWRSNEYRVPVSVRSIVDTSDASTRLAAWRLQNDRISIRAIVSGLPSPVGNKVMLPGQKDIYAKGGEVKRHFDSLPAFATGGQYGQFRGPGTGTSDSILARVSNGEFINTARSVAYYGTQFFDDLNRMRIPRYAVGGMVGPGGGGGSGASVNVEVNQYYPTTQDPIAKLREDAESVIAGIWT